MSTAASPPLDDVRQPAHGCLIVNADDWGGWPTATDAARVCFDAGRITSVSAMVFMEDSLRAASLAQTSGLDVGLHLNLNQAFTGNAPPAVSAAHERVRSFLRRNRYAQLLYNPWLKGAFRTVFEAQVDEFSRLYGRAPTHIDGHQHMHLCANMLWDTVIPKGQRVRRSFSFWPGEKSMLNRAYRQWVDARLESTQIVTEYFFSLEQCIRNDRLARVAELAKTSRVELMAHPEKPMEKEFLLGERFHATFSDVRLAPYSELSSRN